MKRLFVFLAVMAFISPVFGVWLADLVGYREPLDVAAEAVNEVANKTLGKPILVDITEEINWTPFLDYTVPGLPDWAGYIVSAFIGLAIFYVIWLVATHVKRGS
ncbi:MAG: PDGLE domain-containing protein [Pyrobaculum sp.]|jgi:cobalt/nickel transport protein